MEKKFIYIAITGPESSGKTTLSEALSKIYDCTLVSEFARSYLKDINYNKSDVLYMAKMQIELEKEAKNNSSKIIICDTDIINFKIWLTYYNYEIPSFILEHIKSQPYALSLLLYPNTVWVDDGLRDKANERIELYKEFEKELQFYHYNYAVIDQLDQNRTKQAVEIIDAFLDSSTVSNVD